MKTLILLLSPFYLFSQPCPPQGDNKRKEIIAADLLKNRSWCPSKDKAIGYSFVLLGKDAIKDTGFIYVDAYITSAKISGVESCECHIANPDYQDYHIYISDSPTNIKKNRNQIVEVSRYSRALNPQLNFKYVKSLVGHKVRIYGYTFIDEEHKSAIGDWRMGLQEIHPVMYIDKID